jgi:hypothetical protein
MKTKPSYAQLLAQRQQLLRQLADWPPILRGTIRRHLNKCGNPHCRCHDAQHPQRHGPYDYLSHRHGDKTQTIFLNQAKRSHAAAWVDNYHRLIETIYQLSEINFQILRYHYEKLAPQADSAHGSRAD